MPLVRLFLSNEALPVKNRLDSLLPDLVSGAMAAERGWDEETFSCSSQGWAGERHGYDILVVIDAPFFLERQENLAERTQQITDGLAFLREEFCLKVGLWVRLLPGKWQDV